MSKIQKNKEIRTLENKLILQYSLIFKIFIFLTLIFVLFYLVISMGIYIWGYDHDWAFLSFKDWILVMSGLICLFILFKIGLYYRFKSIDKKRIKKEKKPEFIQGKRVYVYTYPEDTDGGVFSKTYVSIDENNVLRLRLLMLKPDELWSN
jgi:hypothetical protein